MFRRYVAAGLAIEVLYLLAALGPLSLLAHGRELADLRKLTGTTLSAALLVTAGLLLLFGLYLVAANAPARDRRMLHLAIVLTAIFSATLVFVYPVTAIDVFNYAVEGHVAAFDKINPLITAPNAATNDPFAAYGGMWSDSPSPYGPIWILLSKLAAEVAGPNIVLAVVLLKAFGALSVVATTLLLVYALRNADPRLRLTAATLFGWNPLVQIDLVANAHNDAAITLLIVAGLVMFAKHLTALGGLSVGASLLIKVLAIGVVPLYLLALLLDRRSAFHRRIASVVVVLIGLAGLAVLAYRPYWVGPETIHRLLIADGDYLASLSSLVVFLIPTSRDWLVYPRVGLAALVGLWQVYGMVFGKVRLPAAAFEMLFATILLAGHFAGWYLPLLLALGILSGSPAKIRRAVIFTASATMTTPLWAYGYTLDVDWMNAESFHFIVVPLTFIPPLLLTFPPSQRLLNALTLRGHQRLRTLVASS